MAVEKRRDARLAQVGHLSLPELRKLSSETSTALTYTKFGRYHGVFAHLMDRSDLLPPKVSALVIGPGVESSPFADPNATSTKDLLFSFEPFELANSLERAGKPYHIDVLDRNEDALQLIKDQRFLPASDLQAPRGYLNRFFPCALHTDFPSDRLRAAGHPPDALDATSASPTKHAPTSPPSPATSATSHASPATTPTTSSG